jgi:hypothetical protein
MLAVEALDEEIDFVPSGLDRHARLLYGFPKAGRRKRHRLVLLAGQEAGAPCPGRRHLSQNRVRSPLRGARPLSMERVLDRSISFAVLIRK